MSQRTSSTQPITSITIGTYFAIYIFIFAMAVTRLPANPLVLSLIMVSYTAISASSGMILFYWKKYGITIPNPWLAIPHFFRSGRRGNLMLIVQASISVGICTGQIAWLENMGRISDWESIVYLGLYGLLAAIVITALMRKTSVSAVVNYASWLLINTGIAGLILGVYIYLIGYPLPALFDHGALWLQVTYAQVVCSMLIVIDTLRMITSLRQPT